MFNLSETFKRLVLFLFILFCLQAALVASDEDEDELEEQQRARTTLLVPNANCSITYKNNSLSYDRCLDLNGGFQMYWNVPPKSSSFANVSIAFSSDVGTEWIGIAKSATGKMVGSSSMVGYPSADGVVVKQYYLGGKRKAKVVPGGNLTVNDIKGEIAGSKTTIAFSLLLNSSELNSTIFIWAKGSYDETLGDILSRHQKEYTGLVGFFAEPVSQSLAKNSSSCVLSYGGASESYENCQTLNGDFGLLWNSTASGTKTKLSVAFNATSSGYIGLGFGNTMRGSSAIIGRVSDSGLVVKQYLLATYTASTVLPGGSLTVSNLVGEFVSSVITVKFTIELPTSDITSVNLIWAKGTYTPSKGEILNEHANAYKAQINFVEGKSTGKSAGESTSNDELENKHGILNAVGWGIIIPLGILTARYLRRQDPLWFYLHITLQITGSALGLAGFITGIQLKNRAGKTENPHFAIGIVILVLTLLQLTALVLRPKPGQSPLRKVWAGLHSWSGIVILILAIVNIYIGFNLIQAQDKYKIAFSVIFALICALALILEMASCFGIYKRLPNPQEKGSRFPDNGEVALTSTK